MAAFQYVLKEFLEISEKLNSLLILSQQNDTAFKKTIVYQSPQYDSMQIFFTLLLPDLVIEGRHTLEYNKCSLFENNQDITKFPR